MRQYPEDEKFRMRVHGFSETMLRVHYISSSPNYNDGKSVSYHVPLCGVFICDETLRDGIIINGEFEKAKFSLYDSIEPIICDRWPQAKIYRPADIENVKKKLPSLAKRKRSNQPHQLRAAVKLRRGSQ